MKSIIKLFTSLLIMFPSALYPQFNYINQQPPGDKAELFAPGFISTGMNEFNSVFTKDGREFFFSIRFRNDLFVILHSSFKNGNWQEPETAPFSGRYKDADPFISPDGEYLYFCSDRPLSAVDSFPDWNIWRVRKNSTGWGAPEYLAFNSDTKNEMYPTVSSNNNLYFHADYESPRKEVDFTKTDLYISKYSGGINLKPEKLNISSSDFPEWDPLISPQDDYLIFTSPRPGGFGSGDMYISFKNEKGLWSDPKNMGPAVNSNEQDYCPSLSPDGKYLFFSSYRVNDNMKNASESYQSLNKFYFNPGNGFGDVYWVSSSIIEELR